MDFGQGAMEVLGALSDGMAGVVGKAGPSVVGVSGRGRRPASGVVFAPGLVLTVNHALERGPEREEAVSVNTHDGRSLEARLAGRDFASDLAVLRVEGLEEPALSPSEGARMGEISISAGRPGRGDLEVALGVVSAVGGSQRVWSGRHGGRGGWRGPRLESYVQTDAAPYYGLGGGALLNARGNVLGIVVAGRGRGATIAVPSDTAWRVARALESRGSTRRGYLGILSQPVRLPGSEEGSAQSRGLLIASVEEDSPAGHGGVLVGDILTTVDGQTVQDTDDLLGLLADERVGREVPVQVIRGGEPKTLRITVGERG